VVSGISEPSTYLNPSTSLRVRLAKPAPVPTNFKGQFKNSGSWICLATILLNWKKASPTSFLDLEFVEIEIQIK